MSIDSGHEQALFLDCLELEGDAREARLAGVTPDLALRVRRLLAAHSEAAVRGMTLGSAIEDPPPATIGPYRILEPLGEGGMGEVYLAAQTEPVRRVVAIKLLKPGVGGTGLAGRFDAERHALALMTHPGIARILDAGRGPDGRPYFVMEYVAGLPITRYCNERRLGVAERLGLMQSVCAAVQHAHYKGVIHRDLKPSNIMVTEIDGVATPKVIDFGIAKLLQPSPDTDQMHTRAGFAIGTPDYMSPEQALPTALDIDTRTDVWSLGAVLYELLTGVTPRPGGALATGQGLDTPRPSRRVSAEAAGDTHARDCGLGSGRELAALLEDELDWVCLKALAQDRAARYSSPAELGADIGRHLTRDAVEARPPTFIYSARKFLHRNRVLAAVTLTTLGAVVVFAAMLSQHARELRAERDRANQEAALARRITEFTAELFERASPSAAGGGALTARELLDVATRQLRGGDDEEDTPEVRAALLESVGNAYVGLGLYDEARPLLGDAVTLRRDGAAASPEALGAALLSQAQLERARGDFPQALQSGREALAVLEQAPKARPEDLLRARLGLAETARRSGSLDEAMDLAQSVLDTLEQREATGGEEYADGLYTLGRIKAAAGDLDVGIALLEQAVERQRALHGKLSLQVQEAKNGLADALAVRGDLLRAEQLMREVYSTSRLVFGAAHHETGIVLSNLANVISDYPERFAEAEAAYREAAGILKARLGSSNPETATVLNNLGALLLKQQDWAAADETYREVISIRLAVLGAEHPDTVSAKMGRALAINKLEQYPEARALLDEAVAGFTASLGADHWRTANARRYLGTVLTNLGLFDDAQAELDRAYADLAAALGPEHPRTLSARTALTELDDARRAQRLGR